MKYWMKGKIKKKKHNRSLLNKSLRPMLVALWDCNANVVDMNTD